MKNRTELAKHFKELGFRTGAEIGVCSGTYSQILCENNPDLKLYCVDNWGEGKRVDKRWQRKYEEAKSRLAPYNTVIIRKISLDAAKDFEDGSLDFVYIDADHSYNSVKEDINAWAPKVRIGGIVAGHDYYYTRAGNIGVIAAVNEYVKENDYDLQLTDWDLESQPYTEPETHHYRIGDEQQPNWWFVKDK